MPNFDVEATVRFSYLEAEDKKAAEWEFKRNLVDVVDLIHGPQRRIIEIKDVVAREIDLEIAAREMKDIEEQMQM
jgi:hypothetical protein